MHRRTKNLWLILTFCCGLSGPASGVIYLAILTINRPPDRFPVLGTQTLINQNWKQLKLITLPEGTPANKDTLFEETGRALSGGQLKILDSIDQRFLYTEQGCPDPEKQVSWLIDVDSFPDTESGVHSQIGHILASYPGNKFSPLPPLHTVTKKFQSTLLTVTPAESLASLTFHLESSNLEGKYKEYLLTPSHKDDLTSHLEQLSVNPPPLPRASPTVIPSIYELIPTEADYPTTDQLHERGIPSLSKLPQWKKVKTIKSGTFGKVILYESPEEPTQQVVVKQLKSDSKHFHTLAREAALLHDMRNDYILDLRGIATVGQPGKEELWIALEYMPNGNLMQILKKEREEQSQEAGKKSPTLFNKHTIMKITRDIACGVQFLHSHHIVHRDLKPENILVAVEDGKTLRIKIADFNLSACVNTGTPLKRKTCSPLYTAPETFLHPQPHRHPLKADIWGIGIILYVTFTKDYPLKDPPQELHQITAWRAHRLNKEVGATNSLKTLRKLTPPAPENAVDLVKTCCQQNPEKRPDITYVLQHPYLTSKRKHHKAATP